MIVYFSNYPVASSAIVAVAAAAVAITIPSQAIMEHQTASSVRRVEAI
jgi:hypothetical protein